MKLFGAISSAVSSGRTYFAKSARDAAENIFASVAKCASLLPGGGDGDDIPQIALSLFAAAMCPGGSASAETVSEIRHFLAADHSDDEIELVVMRLRAGNQPDLAGAAASRLTQLPESEKTVIMRSLLQAANWNNFYGDDKRSMLRLIASKMLFPEESLAIMERDFLENRSRRERILKSGAGIIAAVVVLLIFILTATFLKSVLFGLILAYFFLPLEKWYERRVFSRRAALFPGRFLAVLMAPFTRVRERLTGRSSRGADPAEREKQRKRSLVAKSSSAAVVTVIAGALILSYMTLTFSVSYIAGVGSSVKRWADEKVIAGSIASEIPGEAAAVPPASSGGYYKTLATVVFNKVESWRPAIENLPFLRDAVARIKNLARDSQSFESLAEIILRKSGGIFSFTASFLKNFFSFLLNFLLTFFFFALFLNKIAMSETNGGSLVKSVFDSKWLPYMSPESRGQAQDILENIFQRLKKWARGYLHLVIIESFVYSFLFLIVGVPYAPVLGIIAGCCAILPYIGVVGSAILTVSVCLAVGEGAGGFMILAVLLVYVFVCACLDQLILYPKFIGGALGLSTIETIIVVLLGGLFFGIPGMIFAVPTASVLKYLIPKIYSCWS
jgi:predicted PurR-regulated permease PerM